MTKKEHSETKQSFEPQKKQKSIRKQKQDQSSESESQPESQHKSSEVSPNAVQTDCQFSKLIESVPQTIEKLRLAKSEKPENQKDPDVKEDKVQELKWIESQIQDEVTRIFEQLRRRFNESRPKLCIQCYMWINEFFVNNYRRIIFHNYSIQFKYQKTSPDYHAIRKDYISRLYEALKNEFKSIQKGFYSLEKHEENDNDLEVYRIASPGKLIFPSQKDINDLWTKSDDEDEADDYLYCQNSQELEEYLAQAQQNERDRLRRMTNDQPPNSFIVVHVPQSYIL